MIKYESISNLFDFFVSCHRIIVQKRRTSGKGHKIVIMRENIIPYRDDKGILYIGVEKFLLDKETTK